MTTVHTQIEYEQERASNIYLMSLAIIIVGLPLPIINFVATLFMYLSNRNGSWFVRFHSLQALLSQGAVAVVNAVAFYWSMSVLFGEETISNPWIAYLITAALFNISEFIGTIYAAIRVRKGIHVTFWFFGPLTELLCKKDPELP